MEKHKKKEMTAIDNSSAQNSCLETAPKDKGSMGVFSKCDIRTMVTLQPTGM
jgi:hypothetical protein